MKLLVTLLAIVSVASAFQAIALPFGYSDLVPWLSKQLLELHHDKHHVGYATKLNSLTAGTSLANKTLDVLVSTQTGTIYNQAAQLWNHNFYWQSLTLANTTTPSASVVSAISASFGSLAAFKTQFASVATAHFGSGWVWLVKNANGTLAIWEGHDAGNPLTVGATPILVIDCWEHAYYVDYYNVRATYVNSWWSYVNWNFTAQNLAHRP